MPSSLRSSLSLLCLLLLPAASVAKANPTQVPDAKALAAQLVAKSKTTAPNPTQGAYKAEFDPVEELWQAFMIFTMGCLLVMCEQGLWSYLAMTADFEAFKPGLPMGVGRQDNSHRLTQLLQSNYSYVILSMLCGLIRGGWQGLIFGFLLVLFARFSPVTSLIALGAQLGLWKPSNRPDRKLGWWDLKEALLLWISAVFVVTSVFYGIVSVANVDPQTIVTETRHVRFMVLIVSTLFLAYYIYFQRDQEPKKQEEADEA